MSVNVCRTMRWAVAGYGLAVALLAGAQAQILQEDQLPPQSNEGGNEAELLPTAKVDIAAIEKALDAGCSEVPEQVAALARQLSDNSWRVREMAQKKLKELGLSVLPALKRVYQETGDTEVRARIEQIFRDMLPPRILRANLQLGQMGVHLDIEGATEQTDGMSIRQVMPASAAEKAGLRSGDVVIGLNGWKYDPAAGPDGLRYRIMAAGRGATVKVTFRREGRVMETTVTLDARDEFSIESERAEFESWYWQQWFDSHVKSAKQPGAQPN